MISLFLREFYLAVFYKTRYHQVKAKTLRYDWDFKAAFSGCKKKKKKEKKHREGVLYMQTQQGNNREGNFLPQNVAFLFSKVV